MSTYRYEDVVDVLEPLVQCKARQLIRRPEFDAREEEDIQQDLRLHAFRRLGKYDPARAKMTTFLDRIVCHKIASMLRYRRAQKRDFGIKTVPLDEFEIDYDQQMIASGRATRPHLEQLELKVDVEWVEDSLPKHLRSLYRALQHKTVSQLSRDSGTPRSTIYERIHELREHMDAAGLSRYLPMTPTPCGLGR